MSQPRSLAYIEESEKLVMYEGLGHNYVNGRDYAKLDRAVNSTSFGLLIVPALWPCFCPFNFESPVLCGHTIEHKSQNFSRLGLIVV